MNSARKQPVRVARVRRGRPTGGGTGGATPTKQNTAATSPKNSKGNAKANTTANTKPTQPTPKAKKQSVAPPDANTRAFVLNALVDVMGSELDKKIVSRTAASNSKTPRDIITTEQSPPAVRTGGAPPRRHVGGVDGDPYGAYVQANHPPRARYQPPVQGVITDGMERVLKMCVAATIVLLWVGVFNPSMAFSFFKNKIMWVFKKLFGGVVKNMMKLVIKFAWVMFATLRFIWRNMRGKKFVIAFGLSGLIYRLNWKHVGSSLGELAEKTKEIIHAAYYKIMDMLSSNMLQPLKDILVEPNKRLVADLGTHVRNLAEWFIGLFESVVNVLTGRRREERRQQEVFFNARGAFQD